MGAEASKYIEALNGRIDSGDLVLEDVPCLCGETDFDLLATFDRYRIQNSTVICRHCGLIQSNPRMSDQETTAFYTSDAYRWIYDEALMQIDRASFLALVERSSYRFDYAVEQRGGVPSSVLEIGCGGGWNLWPYMEAGASTVGYDHGSLLVQYGQSLGLDLRHGSVENTGDERFDLIIISHVLEHFLDPVLELTAITKNLADGGALYVEVPNADHFCIGGLQNAHTYYFSPRTLSAYMGKAGLRIVAEKLFSSHVGVVAQPAAATGPDLAGEYDAMARRIRSHDQRERFKDTLGKVGLLGAARRLKSITAR